MFTTDPVQDREEHIAFCMRQAKLSQPLPRQGVAYLATNREEWLAEAKRAHEELAMFKAAIRPLTYPASAS